VKQLIILFMHRINWNGGVQNYVFYSTQAGISSNVTILMYFNSKIMTSARYKVHLKCINVPGALSGESPIRMGNAVSRIVPKQLDDQSQN